MNFDQALKQYRWHLFAIGLLLVAVYWQIMPAMVLEWYTDENYSHGFLVPLIAGYFFWQRWPEVKAIPLEPSNWGLVVLLAGGFQLLFSWLGSEYFLMRSSLIVLLAGLVLFVFGREVLKGMALPLGYLFFMVPIPYLLYDMIAFPLKLFVTKVSVLFLQLCGVVVVREGNVIMFPTTTLEVADACSGIRSLISLVALALAYACIITIPPWKRVVLIVAALPIAIATNASRVIVTGFLAQYWGAQAAQGFFHEFTGIVVFVLAMALLLVLGVLLKRLPPGTGRPT